MHGSAFSKVIETFFLHLNRVYYYTNVVSLNYSKFIV